MRLAKNGWWGGDPSKILQTPMDQVMAALQYEVFLNDYEATTIEIMKDQRVN